MPGATRATTPRTKAEAERLVLAANGQALATTALRPHLVWGPGDTQLVPRILDRARRKRLTLIDGGTARIDTTYIDDAAAAHLAALDRIAPGSACAGPRVFHHVGRSSTDGAIDQLHPGGGWPAGGESKRAAGRSRWEPAAPRSGLWRLTRRSGEPPMTRFLARQLSTEHWFDISAARRDLAYVPRVGIDEGMLRLAQWLQAPHP